MRRKLGSLLAGSIGLAIAASVGFGHAASTQENRRSAALALEQQGRLSDAESTWQAIAKTDPNNAEAYAHLGLLQAREEHYKQAIGLYRKALALQPTMPGLRLNLGLAYFKGGELNAAIATFEPLLREAPVDSPEALRLTTLIGLADYGLGAYGTAIPHLKKATAADPQNIPFLLMLARSCLWVKQYQCALDVYREILVLNPESAEADMLAGEAYDEMKNEAGAIERFQAAIKAGPKTPDVHFGYGYLLWRDLRFNEAESEFNAELANNPDHALALTYLADTEIHLNHADEAVPHLEHALQVQPSIALAHLDLGVTYAGQGRNEDAFRELEEAERLSPGDAKVHWQVGRFYQTLGRTVEAKAEFAKTRTLQQAADQPLAEKLRPVQTKPAEPSIDTTSK